MIEVGRGRSCCVQGPRQLSRSGEPQTLLTFLLGSCRPRSGGSRGLALVGLPLNGPCAGLINGGVKWSQYWTSTVMVINYKNIITTILDLENCSRKKPHLLQFFGKKIEKQKFRCTKFNHRFPGQHDFTPRRRNTLSPASRSLCLHLPTLACRSIFGFESS